MRLPDQTLLEDLPYRLRLFEALPVGVVLRSADGDILASNAAAQEILGMRVDEIHRLRPGDQRFCCLREDGSEITSADELPANRVLATGLPVNNVVLGIVNQASGRRVWVNVSAIPVQRASEDVGAAVCVTFSDITRMRSSAERAALWGHAFEFAELGLVMGDFASGRLLGANQRFASDRGEAPRALAGRPVLSLFPPEQADVVAEHFGRLLSTGHALFTSENLRADGGRFPVSVDVTLLRNADGQPAQWIGYVIDLTEQRRLEAGLRYSESRHRALIDQATPDAIFIHDHEGRLLEVNRRACDSLGYSKEELLALNVTDLDPAADLAGLQALWRNARPGQVLTIEGQLRRKDGTDYPVEVRICLLQESPERLYLAILRDLSERQRTSEYLRLANQVYQSSNEAILITDGDGRLIDCNAAFTRITGHALADMMGSADHFERSFGAAQWIGQEFRRSIDTSGRWQGELWDRRKDGTAYARSVAVTALRDPAGQIFRYVVHFSDISERRLREGLLRRQQDADVLTGLPGRMTFAEQLNDEMQRARAKDRRLALLCLDLHRFKDLNESLGLAKGDQVLREVAMRLRGGVREGDLVARLGSDEFAVLLRDFGSPSVVEHLAAMLLQATAAPLHLTAETVEVAASLGMALFPEDADTVEGLLHCAHQALELAKKRGRMRQAWFTESHQRVSRERMLLLNDLRHAVGLGQLVLHYQPIVDLANGTFTKAEALVRWHHPVRGLLPPGEFIGLAEDNKERDLIVEIGEWVGREAVGMAQELRQRLGRAVQIGVNQSPVQFAEGTAALQWHHRLRDLGMPGDAIVVEITEGVLMQVNSDPVIAERLRELEGQGLHLAIDDFGTGFSNFAFLVNADIDLVKIDREQFIARLLDDPKCQTVVEAIIAMARKLGIRTVAEGVETQAQLAWLRRAGCDYGQGFLFARPLDAEDFVEFMVHGGVSGPVAESM